MHPSWSFIKVK